MILRVLTNEIVVSISAKLYSNVMRIAVFGATGKVGKSIVVKLIEQNHTVTAFEDGANPFVNHPSIRIIQGDPNNVSDIARTLDGADAVISTLAGGGGVDAAQASVTRNILTEMERRDIWRIVSLSSSVTYIEGDSLDFINKWISRMYSLKMPHTTRNEEDHIRFLQSSKADWVVVRSPIIRSRGKKGGWEFVQAPPYPWQRVHVDDVAEALVSQLTDNRYLNQAPFIRMK